MLPDLLIPQDEHSWREFEAQLSSTLETYNSAIEQQLGALLESGTINEVELRVLHNETLKYQFSSISQAIALIELGSINTAFKSGCINPVAPLDSAIHESMSLLSDEALASNPLLKKQQELGTQIQTELESLIEERVNSSPILLLLKAHDHEDLQKSAKNIPDDGIRHKISLRSVLWKLDDYYHEIFWSETEQIHRKPGVGKEWDEFRKLCDNELVPQFGEAGKLLDNPFPMSTIGAGLFVSTRQLIEILGEDYWAYEKLLADLSGAAGRFSSFFIREHGLGDLQLQLTKDETIENTLHSMQQKAFDRTPRASFLIARAAQELKNT